MSERCPNCLDGVTFKRKLISEMSREELLEVVAFLLSDKERDAEAIARWRGLVQLMRAERARMKTWLKDNRPEALLVLGWLCIAAGIACWWPSIACVWVGIGLCVVGLSEARSHAVHWDSSQKKG